MWHARVAGRLAGMTTPLCRNVRGTGVFTGLLVVVALLATACSHSSSGPGVANVGSSSGSGGSPSGGESSSSASVVAYSACMRSHGVSNFPDPGSDGQVPKGDARYFGVSTSQFQAAQHACQHLLATGGSLQQREEQCIESGGPCSPALLQQMLTADRKFAECMRSHGWPDFPDPSPQSDGPVFNITAAGISDATSHTHRFEATLDVCERVVGGNAPYVFG
jgi:hypothetical protein